MGIYDPKTPEQRWVCITKIKSKQRWVPATQLESAQHGGYTRNEKYLFINKFIYIYLSIYRPIYFEKPSVPPPLL